nr:MULTISPECIES: hypothetical protein [Providencia]
MSDSKSIPSVSTSNGQTNYNHAEQKLFSDINDNYKGKNAEIAIAVENTSQKVPGMCDGCQQTSLEFAKQNERFNITIYQGTTGIRKEWAHH